MLDHLREPLMLLGLACVVATIWFSGHTRQMQDRTGHGYYPPLDPKLSQAICAGYD